MQALTVFRIRDTVDGQPVNAFEAAIDPDKLAGLSTSGPIEGPGFEALLYYTAAFPHEPKWAGYLRSGFGDDVTFPRSATAAAVVVVRIERRGRHHYLAFVFGTGRYLLRDEAILRNFGFRAALNIMFEGDKRVGSFDPSRIRAVETTRVDRNTVRSRRQATRKDTLEAFDLDLDRDFLNGVTGEPYDVSKWGSRITGMDSIQMTLEADVQDLGDVSQRLLAAAARKDYQARFAWIDDVAPVRDAELISQLEDEVLTRIRNRDVKGLDLTLPEIVDWNTIVDFHFPGDGSVTHPELDLRALVTSISRRHLLARLTIEQLKRMKIAAYDASGARASEWTIWRCLAGEVRANATTYLLDGGQFYEISRDYASALNSYLMNNLPEADLILPPARLGMTEPEYNRTAAASDARLLLLDALTVIPRKGTSQIEICDLLSEDGTLIHVKRGLGSKGLSHLFAQGSVAAELLLDDDDFRTEAAKQIATTAGRRRASFGHFNSPPLPENLKLVFGVIRLRKEDEFPAQRLPFFSKVNLRRHIQRLKTRGVTVAFAKVNIEVD